MSGPKFTKAQREANLLTVSDMYLRRKKQIEIAAALGVSQAQVSGYVRTLYKRWAKEAAENVDRLKARLLAQLDDVDAQYAAGFETSQKFLSEEGKSVVVAGDPRFLEGRLKVVAQICRILGVEAPAKIAPTDPTGTKAYESLTDGERAARIAALLDAARARRDGPAADADAGNPGSLDAATGPADGGV